MGGEITVQSQPGAGSTFTARLPAPDADVGATGSVETAGSAGAAPAGTVLVIDDDPQMRELMQRYLVKEGYCVLSAGSGEQGLALAREKHPDIITLDIILPGISGWTVLASLTGDPQLGGTPVIIVSMLDDRKTGYALGASDYLTKPIDRARLTGALHRYRLDRPVLVVDDDEMMRTQLRRILEAEGYAVVEAAHGRAALQAMQQSSPGVILLDLLMPDMDGFEFLALMRQHEAWRDIPVFIVTAKEMTAEDRLRLNGSVVRVLEKCATGQERLLADVRSLVRSALRSRRKERA